MDDKKKHLEHKMNADAINRRLASRPSSEELIESGILKATCNYLSLLSNATAPSPFLL